MKLSEPQAHVLRTLDGAIAPVEFNGTYKRTIDSLVRKGLVKYRTRRQPSPTFYYPGGTTLVVVTTLTDKGWHFVYNGGIDS